MGRKHISDKTRLAATLLARGEIPYTDAKNMSADQLISLYEWHHNAYHNTGSTEAVPDIDHFSNLEPMLIKAHRERTKQDAKIIAKSRRIRAWNEPLRKNAIDCTTRTLLAGVPPRSIRSRGFDKRFKRKMSGKVVKR